MQPTSSPFIKSQKKQLVSFKTRYGMTKALISFINGRKRGIPEVYYPSREYYDFIKGLNLQEDAIRKRIMNNDYDKIGISEYAKKKMCMAVSHNIFAKVMNPKLNDYWFIERVMKKRLKKLDWTTAKFN